MSPEVTSKEDGVDSSSNAESEDDREENKGEGYDGELKLRDLTGSRVHQFPGLMREHWWYVVLAPAEADLRQLWRPRRAPPPPKASLADAEVIPLAYVNVFSKLTFSVSQQ
jgi:hypothetical protein